jgi:hypothetical protein
MLSAAEFAYAPANCSPLIRELAREGKCRIVKGQFQNGLLSAVRDRLKPVRPLEEIISTRPGLMESLLHAADRGPVPQALSALMWWNI